MDFEVREIVNIPRTDVLGQYNYVEQVKKVFKFYKSSTSQQQLATRLIEFKVNGKEFSLIPISFVHTMQNDLIQELTDLRNAFIHIYPNSKNASFNSTEVWLKNSVIGNELRILFLVQGQDGLNHGHLGLWQRDDHTLEVDNVLKAPGSQVPGLFSNALHALERWINEVANVANLELRVLQSNSHARDFYAKLGYSDFSVTPMKWVDSDDGSKTLEDATEDDSNEAWVTMSKSLENDFKPGAIIPTAGPSITAFEVAFVADAVKTGWNSHHSDYLIEFSKVFGDYVGAKFVIPTDSCTSALHLGLWALGLGPGDEVIVPDLTWVATANAVRYVGATPVFADIDQNTWCIDPKEVEKLITPRTKAIVPVHLYGYVANIPELEKLASAHNLSILQDAAPGIGSSINGKGVAQFGDFTAFSFQGAKLLVSGEGGALTTNNEELYQKAFKIADVGRKPGTFWIEEFGKKMKMSNVTAALALGQMQSVERQIEKKKRIQEWYYEELSPLTELSFQYEAIGTRSIAWMTSINMSRYGVNRDKVRADLLNLGVDTRPVFPAISTYPIWAEEYAGSKISNSVGENSINLPSGVRLNRESVRFICEQIKKVLES